MKVLKKTNIEAGVQQKRSMADSLRVALALVVIAASSPGYCQLTALTTKVNTLSTWLYSIAGVVTTMALMWCGFKMFKRGEGFDDIKGVFIGGIVIGAAAGIAGWMVS